MSPQFVGSQTVDAYSSTGLTIVLYVAALTVGVHSLKFLLKKPTVLFPLFTVALIWFD